MREPPTVLTNVTIVAPRSVCWIGDVRSNYRGKRLVNVRARRRLRILRQVRLCVRRIGMLRSLRALSRYPLSLM